MLRRLFAAPRANCILPLISVHRSCSTALKPVSDLVTTPAAGDSSADSPAVVPPTREEQLFSQFGEGTFRLYKSIYKDLCDEMRREPHAKAPPPHLSDLKWTVRHDAPNNQLIFEHPSSEERRLGRVLAFTDIAMADPPRKNEILTFTTWYAVEVLIERNDTVVHVSLGQAECNMHMRNVRVYKKSDAVDVFDTSKAGHWARQNLLYDGPCLFHLELKLQQELYEIMMDHGVNVDFMMWVSQWVYFVEHQAWLNWTINILNNLIPIEKIESEDDVLTKAEQEILKERTEDWLPARDL